MLYSTSISLATAQLPHWRNQPMLAPSQMKFDTVREPDDEVALGVKASSLRRSCGLNVPSGSQTQIRSVSTSMQPALDRGAVTLAGLEDLARGRWWRPPRDVPVGGVVVDTRMSSTTPSASNAADAVGDAVLLVVGRQHHRERLTVPHGAPRVRVGDHEHLAGQRLDRRTEVPRARGRSARHLATSW